MTYATLVKWTTLQRQVILFNRLDQRSSKAGRSTNHNRLKALRLKQSKHVVAMAKDLGLKVLWEYGRVKCLSVAVSGLTVWDARQFTALNRML